MARILIAWPGAAIDSTGPLDAIRGARRQSFFLEPYCIL